MSTAAISDQTLSHWLTAVSSQLQVRRIENQGRPRPTRNRERERARREARKLFADYYAEVALASVIH